MNNTFRFLTRNKVSRFLYGIYNEQVSYACSRVPDQKRNTRKKFIIYGQGRTGSTLLVNILNSHPQIFCEREILMDKNLPWDGQVDDPLRLIEGKASLFRRKVYGFKVKIYQLTEQRSISSPAAFLREATSRGWKIIYLKRENAFEHVLSNIVAESLNQYHFSKRGKKDNFQKLKVRVDVASLSRRIAERIRFAEEEQASLHGIPHITVIYEELASDNQRIANDVFRHLGLPEARVKTTLKKSNTKKYSELIENFDEVQSFLQENGYDHYLVPSKL